MQKTTLEKVFEYASMPLHGTLSRKLRKQLKIQINEGAIYESAVLFLGEEFVRITQEKDGESINTYYSWEDIGSVRTFSPIEK
ncbi:hypothetical protein [Desulfovibrio gilichinskyi]|uniref:Uncharacterized protein n=1 Tax=Desulfovibrio gilichinskyi TaxID=1519643 RepID=A0A1X7CGP3_9BACT|nr:hypothetical protein [Desulfovibrio gilichinskyi]SME96028.1 hypothetical protein SAMN06295933_0857 [Desulfovibrio gilichinskyi]